VKTPGSHQVSDGHAIVTGGSSGIGLAIARLLARRGSSITIIARTPSRLAAARDAIVACLPSTSQAVVALEADVSRREQIEAAIGEAIRRSGPPQVLVTSAGVASVAAFVDTPPETFERVMAVNYFGSLYAVRAALPVMRTERRGHVCLVSSAAGLLGLFGYSAYSSSKFALRGLAEALRAELKRDGIAVSIAYPPDTDTPMLAEEMRTGLPETRRIASHAGIWSAEAVARAVVRGIDRGRFAITPGWKLTLLRLFHGLAAPAVHRYLDHVVREATRR
jgi:3-dehydrosphinganine reductase